MVDFCFLFFSLVSLSDLSKKVAKEINICGGQEDWVLPQPVLLECSVTVARHCQKQDNAKTCTSIFKLIGFQDGWLMLSERSRATLKKWNEYQTGSDVSYNVPFMILCSVHCNSLEPWSTESEWCLSWVWWQYLWEKQKMMTYFFQLKNHQCVLSDFSLQMIQVLTSISNSYLPAK